MRQAKRFRFAAPAVALVALIAGPVAAQEAEVEAVEPPPAVVAGPDFFDRVELQRVSSRGVLAPRVGEGCLVTLPTEIQRVALADDTIARVQVVSPLEALLTGLQPGHTTLHVWLVDGRRYQYPVHVLPDLRLVRKALADIDPRITVEATPDGSTLVLYGEVDGSEEAQEAIVRARSLAASVGAAEVLNALRHPGPRDPGDIALQAALRSVDSRIRVRRIQVGAVPDPQQDTFVLEGRVRNINDLVRALTIAERQLGETGIGVQAHEDQRIGQNRNRNFTSGLSNLDAVGGGGVGGGISLAGRDPRSSSLAAQVARGLMIASDSGRVVSLLEVDEIHQVLVSIRVLEVDRLKSKRAGINFRFDQEKVSIGQYLSPEITPLRGLENTPTVDDLGQTPLVGAFIDRTTAIVAAFDFLQQKNLARSVAEPNVLTLTGELASVMVGGEVPIPTAAVNQVASVQGFFFQEFGVRLDIRPTVTGNDMVALEVAPSIVRPAPGLGVTDVPGFQVQTVTTTARVQAGQSLVIGGLLSFEEGLEDRRLPGLGKFPLFRWKEKSRAERELLFLITPRLVRTENRPSAPIDATTVVEAPEVPADWSPSLPELNWPEERDDWRDEFEPVYAAVNGVPQSFVDTYEADPDDEEWWDDERAAAEEPDVTYAPIEGEADADADVGEVVVETAPDDAAYTAGGMDEATGLPEGTTQRVVTATPCLNVRSQPGTWGRPFDCLPVGTVVEVLDERGSWNLIRTPKDQEGWAAKVYLEPATSEEVDSPDAPSGDGSGQAERSMELLEDDLVELQEAIASATGGSR